MDVPRRTSWPLTPQAIAPALDTLQQQHGIAFELLDGFLYPGHSVRRMHTLPQRTGAALMAALQAAAERAGATLLTHARVHTLWCDATDRVLGVSMQRPDGSDEHLACDALVLACNGFGGNAAMVREHLPAMRDAVFAGHTGNDGSAIAWGRALGARAGRPERLPGPRLVGRAARRAHHLGADDRRRHPGQRDRVGASTTRPCGYSEAAVDVLAQPGGVAWNVFDTRLLELARRFPDFVDAEAAGAVRQAANTPSLADVIGCDAATLADTLATTRLIAPYCAIRVTGALFHTQGGLDVDACSRVLRADGTPLPNLLAAGGAARGVSGDSVSGYLSGNGLLSAVAGGFIAAHTAAAQLRGAA